MHTSFYLKGAKLIYCVNGLIWMLLAQHTDSGLHETEVVLVEQCVEFNGLGKEIVR